MTHALQKIANEGIIGDNGLKKGLIMPVQSQKKTNNLSASILNYFAAFTETKFNFRTLINYRWTNNELTLDLGIFQDFQNFLLTYSKGGKGRTLILEYDGVEYHTKKPDIVTKHNFTQEYLDYVMREELSNE